MLSIKYYAIFEKDHMGTYVTICVINKPHRLYSRAANNQKQALLDAKIREIEEIDRVISEHDPTTIPKSII